jgi:sulfhydrogenase subunit alpha
METALGVALDEPLKELRRLLYCGEWIESHALHVYLLHAPDFLGYEDAIALSRDHPELVKRGLALKQAGNAIVATLGGREIHPINVRVGGFHRLPRPAELDALRAPLEQALEIAEETVRLVGGFNFPSLETDYELLALRDTDSYAMYDGRLVSSRGLDCPVRDFEQHVHEVQVPHSNALQGRIAGRGAYHTGPLARVVLNGSQLHPRARAALAAAGVDARCRNPFKSIIARSVEIVHACEEALRILGSYRAPAHAAVTVRGRRGEGWGASEAPRGILYHRYQLDDAGDIEAANIVPPTSQNQRIIEEDLCRLVEQEPGLDQAALTWRCEQLVRCYDPCISCATHFLRVEVVPS